MAMRSSVTVMDPSLKALLSSVDEDRAAMPNQGMKAITAICGEAAGLMKGAMVASPLALQGVVTGSSSPFPVSRPISSANGAILAGLAALGATAGAGSKHAEKMDKKAAAGSGKEKTDDKTGAKVSEKPATKTDDKSAVKTDEKKAGPEKKEAPKGPVTISLSEGAAKKLHESSWIGVGSKPTDVKPESGEKVPTSIKAIPVQAGETSKKGYEKIQYGGNEYWVSTKDAATYGTWQKGLAQSGGLKADDMSLKADAAPVKPVVSAKPAKPSALIPAATPKPVKEDTPKPKDPVATKPDPKPTDVSTATAPKIDNPLYKSLGIKPEGPQQILPDGTKVPLATSDAGVPGSTSDASAGSAGTSPSLDTGAATDSAPTAAT